MTPAIAATTLPMIIPTALDDDDPLAPSLTPIVVLLGAKVMGITDDKLVGIASVLVLDAADVIDTDITDIRM